MNNVDLFVFSGSGNTLRIAKAISNTISESDLSCEIKSISAETKPSEVNLSNTLGLAFPIACFSTYPFVWEFINELPKTTTNTEVFLFTTFAGNDGQFCAQVTPVLRAKGYKVIGYEGFVMPSNFMVGKIDQAANDKLFEISSERAVKYAKLLLQNSFNFKTSGKIFASFCKTICRLSYGSRMLQKMFKVKVDTEKCTGCGLCETLCPVNNISLNEGKAEIGEQCQDCMRCIAFCPVSAIKVKNSKPYSACTYQNFMEEFND